MGITFDKTLRGEAIPYYGQIFGYNRSENSDQDISKTYTSPGIVGLPGVSTDPSLSGTGDLYPIINNISQNNYMIRILRPKFGHIIQAYLTLNLTFSASETHPNFNVSVGSGFNLDNLTPVTPTTGFIANCMNVLNSPTGGTFNGTAGAATNLVLNIQSLVPQVGNANYVPDFYTIGLHFPNTPVMSGSFHLNKFFVTGSIMVV